MKKRLKYGNIKALRGIVIMMCAVLFLCAPKSTVLADATGTVTAPSAKIRAAADIGSEVIASSSSGKNVSITAKVTDSSGTLWYEVYVDANTKGYIRSDLVKVDESSGAVPSKTAESDATQSTETQSTTTQSTTTQDTTSEGGQSNASGEGTASGAETPAQTPMEAQYASVKVPAAKVRSDASTSSAIVDTIPQNTQLVISGSTAGSDSKTWYYVTFTGTGNAEKTGYVREDLIELGDMLPAQESGEPSGEEEQSGDVPEEEPENKDYEVVYEEGEDGGEWYLYNNIENKKQKLADLLEAAQAQADNEAVDAKTITKQRVAIVIMLFIIVIMALAVTLLFFKIKDAYYESYEDEEDEDEPVVQKAREKTAEKAKEKERARTREQRQAREADMPPKKKTAQSDKKMPVKEVTYEEEPEAVIKPTPKKKPKNFMLDDEDFEFEFLNMKNKDND